MQKPKAYIFDIFGTVVDWRNGVAAYCAGLFASRNIKFDPHQFADLWRAEYQPAMERIRSGGRGYVALDTLHRENLDRVLSATGLEDAFDHDARNELNRAWEHLPPWPDIPEALPRIARNGFIAPCSNGSVALMIRLARFGGLHWDTITGAETARDYKPKPEVYHASCAALGLEPSQVMMVAAHNDDLHAARDAGLTTGFFPRPTEHGEDQKTDLNPKDDWDFIGKSALDLAAFSER